MSKLVLLLSEGESNVESIRKALAGGDEQTTLQHLERPRTAVARIAGGGVAAVLLDLCSATGVEAPGAALAALRAVAPGIPIIVLCEAGDEAAGRQMVDEGAVAYVARPNWQAELKSHILSGIASHQTKSTREGRASKAKGTVISFAGAKGGVGATTVAMNVACVLASSSKVILAELRPPFGSLCYFFRPHRGTRNLRDLLGPDRLQTQVADVESCLWPNRNVPGLKVLFAPEKRDIAEIGSEDASDLVRRLCELSEVVVVDLSESLSDANQSILKASDTLVFVVERDALSVDAAKAKLRALEGAGLVPREAGLVIVNRVALANPMAIADIETHLGLPTYAVIPPAADLCAAAYRVHEPVVKLDPQSSLATSLVSLSHRLTGRP